MRVVCTGMSGTGRTSYVRGVAEAARAAGQTLHVFDVRDAMFHLARERGEHLEEETVLDVFPTALGAYRAAAWSASPPRSRPCRRTSPGSW